MIVSDIIQCLEEAAPLSLQEHYDNSGLLVGSPHQEIKKVLLSLDCTEKVVDEAIKNKCGLIVAHHPVIFSGVKKLTNDHWVNRVLIKCIKNDIALYACHTNIDNTFYGVNYQFAQKLSLQDIQILKPLSDQLVKLSTYAPPQEVPAIQNALFAIGAGEIGHYSQCSFLSEGSGTFMPTEGANPYIGNISERETLAETKIEVILPSYLQSEAVKALKQHHPYEEVAYELVKLENKHQNIGAGMVGNLKKAMNLNDFLAFVSLHMKAKNIRFTSGSRKKIKKVAICGGSGSFLLRDAIKFGADAYISADFKYHEFFEAENELNILDIGHYETEQYTSALFYDILSKKFPKFALRLSNVNTNPINYYTWQK